MCISGGHQPCQAITRSAAGIEEELKMGGTVEVASGYMSVAVQREGMLEQGRQRGGAGEGEQGPGREES